MHGSSYKKMQLFVDEFLAPFRGDNLQILELGSQNVNGTYRPLFSNPNWLYTGADMIKARGVDLVLANPYNWTEIPDNAYDVVISGSLLEHVEYPWITMVETARVLKPNAITCHIAPSAGPCHRYPVDCYRYYPDGFVALAKWADLEVIKAYTAWDDYKIPGDPGNAFNDSVLIARKKNTPDAERRAELMNTLTKHMDQLVPKL